MLELTTVELALKLGINQRTVERWIQSGKLPATRLTNHRYGVSTEDIERLRLREHVDEETRLQAVERRLGEVDSAIKETGSHVAQMVVTIQSLQTRVEGLPEVEHQVNDQDARLTCLHAALQVVTGLVAQLTTAQDELLTLVEALSVRIGEIEAQMHDMRVVYLSKLLEYDPEQMQALTTAVRDLQERVGGLEQAKRITTPTRQEKRATTITSPSSTIATEGLVPVLEFARAHGISEGAAKSAQRPSRGKIPTSVVSGSPERCLSREQQQAALAYWRGKWRPCDDPACPCHAMAEP